MTDIARRSAITLGLGMAVSTPRAASAQDAAAYPSRPVRLLVGWTPGGPLDFVARAVANRLTPRLGQAFIVENRVGATGNVSAEAVGRATLDGYLC